MKHKVLGLDLGVSSIGWAFILEDTDQPSESKIIRCGDMIIPLTTDEKDQFSKGAAQTKNQDRAKKRSMRRQLRRYHQRRKKLVRKLIEIGLLPEPRNRQRHKQAQELHEYLRSKKGDSPLKLYHLRAEGLQRPLTNEEMGRVLLHLNQRRGFKSNRKVRLASEENQEEETIFQEKLHEWNKRQETPGQYFFEELRKDPNFRVKDHRVPRAKYIDEFDRIWFFQAKFHNELTEVNRGSIRDVIYFQRRLKSQKGLVSQCQFEKDYKVCPKTSPFHQLRKVWQDINAIKVNKKPIGKKDKGEPCQITTEMRRALFNELDSKGELSRDEILACWGFVPLRQYRVNLPEIESDDGKHKEAKKLKGNITKHAIREALTATGVEDAERYLSFDYKAEDPQTQPLYGLWHLLYSITDSDDIAGLRKILSDRYGFEEATIDGLLKIDLWHEFSNLSAKASRNLLKHLENGLMYSEACNAVRDGRINHFMALGLTETEANGKAGYRHSDYLTRDENELRPLADKLTLIPWNKLKSPVVEKILNHLINTVNAILIDPELGRPDEIRIEYARELKQNKKRREFAYADNDARDKENKRIRKLLEPYIGIATNQDLDRYKIWEECGKVSPYEPHKIINLTELFDGTKYEMDHIIPQSRLFDDSIHNKVIARCSINLEKLGRTAEDYMLSRSEAEYEAFVTFVKETKSLSDKKKWLLRMKHDEIPNDFIDRQLRETAYICKEAGKRLLQVSRKVTVTSGGITAFLRRRWGMDSILKYLNKERYEAAGRVRWEQDKSGRAILIIDDWSKREDHRHHVVDAIVIACTRPALIKRLNDLNQEYDSYNDLSESGLNIPRPWERLRLDAEHAVKSVLVNFRVGKRLTSNRNGQLIPRGELHKETVYGRRYSKKRVLLGPNFKDEDNILNPEERKLVEDHITFFNGNRKKAFSNLSENPILDPANGREIRSVIIGNPFYTQRVEIGPSFKAVWVEDIMNKQVRKAVQERLAEGKPADVFRDLTKKPIWLNQQAGVAIKRVRVRENVNDPYSLRKNSKGVDIDFVQTRNNHHVTIFEDSDGNKHEGEIVRLINAVARKQDGEPVMKLHIPAKPDWKFLFSMRINELFVFGLRPDEIDFFDPSNYALISEHLYRVQKLGSGDYTFRFHTATTLDDDLLMLRITSAANLNCTKIRLSRANKIIAIGEQIVS